MALEIIDTERFKSEIFDFSQEREFEFKGGEPIILNLFATWCGPCHAFAPALQEAADEHEGRLKIFKIDIDRDPLIAALFGVRSVPATVFFIPGEEPALASGNIGREGLRKAIHELFGLGSATDGH